MKVKFILIKEYKTKGIEVGHIFYFGDKYSKPMNSSVDLMEKKILLKWVLMELVYQG